MEISPSLLLTLKEHPIQVFENSTIKWYNERKNPGFHELVNRLGLLSARARGLNKPLTTFDRLVDSDQKLFVRWEPQGEGNPTNRVIGFAKVGRSRLYLRDEESRPYIQTPSCVMDFYICSSVQRQGNGQKLLEFVLEHEKAAAYECAFDNPTAAFLSFLQSKFQLENPVRQSNRFVVFPQFFANLEPEEEETNSFSRPSSRLNSQRSSVVSPLGSSRADQVEDLIHRNHTPVQRQQFEKDTPKGRKNTRDFSHQSIW